MHLLSFGVITLTSMPSSVLVGSGQEGEEAKVRKLVTMESRLEGEVRREEVRDSKVEGERNGRVTSMAAWGGAALDLWDFFRGLEKRTLMRGLVVEEGGGCRTASDQEVKGAVGGVERAGVGSAMMRRRTRRERSERSCVMVGFG